MIEPTTQDIGRRVMYVPENRLADPFDQVVFAHRGVNSRVPVEEGVITSFNSSYVFVRYGAEPASKATRREDLHWW